ncbi:chemotaxis protein CheB [uncultured Pontibacter sp.]|uniref:chemotaxis protein CheB n=1 Tax=uncultured Pontibacter sp. TaxID=453356 RepID=UPI002625ADD2|nr:chemotaxis protein CheB [uncultured Pontibacter sp.]
MDSSSKLIVIGGSWGGIQASMKILQGLPADFSIPIVLVLHRLRNQEGSLQELFEKKLTLKAIEIDDKTPIESGHVYIAPANYHVLLEKDHTFSLDDSELENYSRPSIDVTFTSAADVFGKNTVAVLLSGASRDGSSGLKAIFEKRGMVIAQDPAEAEVATMPLAAINSIPGCSIMNVERIHAYLLSLHEH